MTTTTAPTSVTTLFDLPYLVIVDVLRVVLFEGVHPLLRERAKTVLRFSWTCGAARRMVTTQPTAQQLWCDFDLSSLMSSLGRVNDAKLRGLPRFIFNNSTRLMSSLNKLFETDVIKVLPHSPLLTELRFSVSPNPTQLKAAFTQISSLSALRHLDLSAKSHKNPLGSKGISFLKVVTLPSSLRSFSLSVTDETRHLLGLVCRGGCTDWSHLESLRLDRLRDVQWSDFVCFTGLRSLELTCSLSSLPNFKKCFPRLQQLIINNTHNCMADDDFVLDGFGDLPSDTLTSFQWVTDDNLHMTPTALQSVADCPHLEAVNLSVCCLNDSMHHELMAALLVFRVPIDLSLFLGPLSSFDLAKWGAAMHPLNTLSFNGSPTDYTVLLQSKCCCQLKELSVILNSSLIVTEELGQQLGATFGNKLDKLSWSGAECVVGLGVFVNHCKCLKEVTVQTRNPITTQWMNEFMSQAKNGMRSVERLGLLSYSTELMWDCDVFGCLPQLKQLTIELASVVNKQHSIDTAVPSISRSCPNLQQLTFLVYSSTDIQPPPNYPFSIVVL